LKTNHLIVSGATIDAKNKLFFKLQQLPNSLDWIEIVLAALQVLYQWISSAG